MAIQARAQPFGRYLLHERIGIGGMAEIFRATYRTEGGFEKTLVIKRIAAHLAEEEEFIAMFREEAALTARLNHANIVQVFDFGREGSNHYLAMEYVEGRNLRQVLERSKELAQTTLPVPFALYVASEVAKGLAFAHTRKDPSGGRLGIVHRDVTPSNVLVSYEGEVKIADFGIARSATSKTNTKPGVVRGKASYLAPEQLSNKETDARVDLWALGAVLWEMLTGARLVAGDSDREILLKLSSGKILTRPSAVRKSVPPEVDRVVMRALQRDPGERYPTAAEFQADLQHLVMRSGVTQSEVAKVMRRLFEERISVEHEATGTVNLDTDPGAVAPTILLVLADARTRDSVASAIRAKSLTVVEAANLEDAEEAARLVTPFAVLLDPALLLQDCTRLYERLAERATAPVRVVALTHDPSPAQVDVAYQQGMSFLIKPLGDGRRLADVLAVFAKAPHGGGTSSAENVIPTGAPTVDDPAILVVDDSATQRALLSRLLVAQGFRVYLADSAVAALRFLRQNDAAVDLVVSDLHMPEMDGFELKHEIDRSRTRPLPFVLVTGDVTDENRELARKLGTSAFVAKPVEPEALLKAVESVLREADVTSAIA